MHFLHGHAQRAPAQPCHSLEAVSQILVTPDNVALLLLYLAGSHQVAATPHRSAWVKIQLCAAPGKFLVDVRYAKNTVAAIEICAIAGQKRIPAAVDDPRVENLVEQIGSCGRQRQRARLSLQALSCKGSAGQLHICRISAESLFAEIIRHAGCPDLFQSLTKILT